MKHHTRYFHGACTLFPYFCMLDEISLVSTTYTHGILFTSKHFLRMRETKKKWNNTWKSECVYDPMLDEYVLLVFMCAVRWNVKQSHCYLCVA